MRIEAPGHWRRAGIGTPTRRLCGSIAGGQVASARERHSDQVRGVRRRFRFDGATLTQSAVVGCMERRSDAPDGLDRTDASRELRVNEIQRDAEKGRD